MPLLPNASARVVFALHALLLPAACADAPSAPATSPAHQFAPEAAGAFVALSDDAIGRLAPAATAGGASDPRALVAALRTARDAAARGDAVTAGAAVEAAQRAIGARADARGEGTDPDRAALGLHLAALRRSLAHADTPREAAP